MFDQSLIDGFDIVIGNPPYVQIQKFPAAQKAIWTTQGFDTYAAYLASDLWKAIRRRVLKKTPKCQACEDRATLVHHRGYYLWVLRGETLTGLIPLCRTCHEHIEFDNGEKVPLGWANSRLVDLQCKNKVGCSWMKAGPCKRCGRLCKAKASQHRKGALCYACQVEKSNAKASAK